MFKNIIIGFLAVVFLAGVAAIYGGIAWGIAWLIETLFSLGVNYTIFVSVGLGLFVLTIIPYVIFGLIAKKQKDAFDKEFKKFGSW